MVIAGFEWVEESGAMDLEPGIAMYSMNDFANTEYVIIKSVYKDGNVSEGVKYYLR
jgi:hypothetical protein